MPTPNRARIPELIRPYTHWSTTSRAGHGLVLLTGTLGAETAWLVLRFLGEALHGVQNHRRQGSQENTQDERGAADGSIGESDVDSREACVVLVSWSKEWGFWKDMGRRACGLDLPRLASQNRFAFVDGVSKAFLPPLDTEVEATPSNATKDAQHTQLPRRAAGPVPARGVPSSSTQSGQSRLEKGEETQLKNGIFTLNDASLSSLNQAVSSAIEHITSSDEVSAVAETLSRRRRIFLVLDTPDILLACNGSSNISSASSSGFSSPSTTSITPNALAAALINLRNKPQVHSTVVAVSADSALLNHPSHSNSHSELKIAPTPLETNHAEFILGLSHTADLLLQCRPLDTGVAGDVSGVLRATLGDLDNDSDEEMESEERLREGEWLYHVRGDASVRVFERGSDAPSGG